MLKEILRAGGAIALFTVTLGVGYPMAVTGVAAMIMPAQAQGSLIEREGVIIGSALVGQRFESDAYFHPRPSYAGDGYAGEDSSGSNLAPTNSELVEAVRARARLEAERNGASIIPLEFLTASSSGLDPHISPASAALQIDRVARARGVDVAVITSLVQAMTDGTRGQILGAPRVNVLLLNLALDEQFPIAAATQQTEGSEA